MKKWNTTHWLGRRLCLEAICEAYPYILNHLKDESINSTDKKVCCIVILLLTDLDESKSWRLIFQNDGLQYNCVHILWCDVTKILGIKHKQVQEQKLQISNVGRLIKLLCVELTEHYRIDSEMPEKFPLVDGYGTHIMHQFWGKNYYTGMFNITFDSNILIYI